jgi:hypothetical protein
MPMHDWTRVQSGTYHNFHYRWIAVLMDQLNAGLLPPGLFAMAEQRISGPEPDVVTLRRPGSSPRTGPTALAPPPVTTVERAETIRYARKTNRIAVHAHHMGNVIAVIEIVSPGNKDTRPALRSFARKSAALVRDGIHLLVIDPFPPGRYDKHGIHRAIWSEVTETSYEPPADRPLTLVSYDAAEMPTAYVEPTAVGRPLADMPLYLDDDFYIMVPLERTYQATWDVMPKEVREVVAPAG